MIVLTRLSTIGACSFSTEMYNCSNRSSFTPTSSVMLINDHGAFVYKPVFIKVFKITVADGFVHVRLGKRAVMFSRDRDKNLIPSV